MMYIHDNDSYYLGPEYSTLIFNVWEKKKASIIYYKKVTEEWKKEL